MGAPHYRSAAVQLPLFLAVLPAVVERDTRSLSSTTINTLGAIIAGDLQPSETTYTQALVTVLRMGDAWLVGVGKRAPHGFQCLCWSLLMARWLGSKLNMHYFPT